MKKGARIVLVTLVVLYGLIYFYWTHRMDKNINERNAKFYKADINGQIESVSIRYHRTAFQLKGSNDYYLFSPNTDRILNDGTIFLNFAKPGDFVVKPPMSDTLQLVHFGKTYCYTFEKND